MKVLFLETPCDYRYSPDGRSIMYSQYEIWLNKIVESKLVKNCYEAENELKEDVAMIIVHHDNIDMDFKKLRSLREKYSRVKFAVCGANLVRDAFEGSLAELFAKAVASDFDYLIYSPHEAKLLLEKILEERAAHGDVK